MKPFENLQHKFLGSKKKGHHFYGSGMSYLTVCDLFVERLERRHLRWVRGVLQKRIMGQVEAVDMSESSDP